jgi:hypothetical protein
MLASWALVRPLLTYRGYSLLIPGPLFPSPLHGPLKGNLGTSWERGIKWEGVGGGSQSQFHPSY